VSRHEQDGAVPLRGFDEFFCTTYPRVLAYARFLARDMVDAELAVADAYAETAKRWTRIHEFEAKEAYVRRLVRQRLERQRRRQLRRVIAELKGHLSPRPADPELSAEVRTVLALIPLLPERQRAVLVLACQEYTSEEIAQELGMKASTVRTHTTVVCGGCGASSSGCDAMTSK
jgi:RNA polymerase sigma-70 factor (ECF subfamily)